MTLSSNGKPATIAAAAAIAACAYAWHLRKRLEREQRLRKEETRGRTRAEAALRNLSRQRDRIPTQSLRTRQVAAIGHVETPFVKRSGTPRQGMVCPSSRGVVTHSPEFGSQLPSRQASSSAEQSCGSPAHMPSIHASDNVHASASSQGVPSSAPG